MQSQTGVDLFGQAIAAPKAATKPSAVRKTPVKIVIDRKALWSTAGNSSYSSRGISMLDDDEDVADATATSDTTCDNATIERLEAALGMAPLIKDNQWVRDMGSFEYKLVGKPFKGNRPFGARGTMQRDLTQMAVLSSARSALEPAFSDPCCWLVLNALGLFAVRLRKMDESEDPYSCLQAFCQVMLQHDFIDNTRSGETIRSLTKRDRERDRRAGVRAAREAKMKEIEEEIVVSDDFMKALESDFDDDL